MVPRFEFGCKVCGHKVRFAQGEGPFFVPIAGVMRHDKAWEIDLSDAICDCNYEVDTPEYEIVLTF